MESLIIEKTSDTPAIVLDPVNNKYEISERSLPENAIAFYEPVLSWITEYTNNPNDNVEFVFNLEYFNTASSKQIVKVLFLLEKLSQKTNVTIRWKYREDDTDMQASGERYSKLLNMNFIVEADK